MLPRSKMFSQVTRGLSGVHMLCNLTSADLLACISLGARLNSNGAYANMAAKYGGQFKRPPEVGIPRFLLAYFLKENGPQRHFS